MSDPILARFARTVVGYSLDTRPGDDLVVRATTLAVPLLREVYREAVCSGAHPHVRISFDGQDETFYREADDALLDRASPLDRAEVEQISSRLTINAPFNTRGLAGVDPRRYAQYARTMREVTERFRQRSAEGAIRWCATVYPTHALAQEAGMSLADYEEFVFAAMFLDRDDPVAAWRAFSAQQQTKVDFLNGVRSLRIVARDTDLTVGVEGRTWMNSDGHRNFPSGEVFTGPAEDSASGHIRFTYPAIAGGREVEDVRLWFEAGRAVRATAARGQDYLDQMLETDPGARFLGEVAFGNNYGIRRFTRNTLFDEKIGGTCHLALGASYAETGGKNQSAIHWDMVCDLREGGEVYADGEVIHRDGRWTL